MNFVMMVMVFGGSIAIGLERLHYMPLPDPAVYLGCVIGLVSVAFELGRAWERRDIEEIEPEPEPKK